MLYHGSKKRVAKLGRRKASSPAGRPKEEGLNAIYLAYDFGFALVCGARPEGITEIDHEARTVRFQNPAAFDPEEKVYIYFVDSSKIPEEKMTWIDQRQVVVDLDKIQPSRVEVHKAGEISKFYSIEGKGEKG